MGNNKKESLCKSLENYSYSDFYPFHMPGHKRAVEVPLLKEFPNPYRIDITEIEGFDNLHHAKGILKESMERAASVYGADKTYYLINGSSCGILSAICALTDNSDTILISRNCHKAAYHGVFLNQLQVKYIYPQIIDDFGVQGGLLPDEIEDMLKTFVDISAVFIVSPTYDGIVSNIRRISTICHNYKIPLIVDEAHGAHFSFGEKFPTSALNLGADIVIQSLHKTLPSFTQTALLHVKGNYVNIEKLEFYLQIFQSSSPSYLLMTGIERCVRFMESEGKIQMKQFENRLEILRQSLGNMRRLRLLDKSVIHKSGVFDLDISKIIVSTNHTHLNGEQLMCRLREDYHLEMEMCSIDSITAITSVMDTEEGLKRLENALISIDRELKEGYGLKSVPKNRMAVKEVMNLSEAWRSEKYSILFENSEGKISGEFIYIYPPGIPLLVPGEEITLEIINTVLDYKRKKLSVQGLKDSSVEWIQVIKK